MEGFLKCRVVWERKQFAHHISEFSPQGRRSVIHKLVLKSEKSTTLGKFSCQLSHSPLEAISSDLLEVSSVKLPGSMLPGQILLFSFSLSRPNWPQIYDPPPQIPGAGIIALHHHFWLNQYFYEIIRTGRSESRLDVVSTYEEKNRQQILACLYLLRPSPLTSAYCNQTLCL